MRKVSKGVEVERKKILLSSPCTPARLQTSVTRPHSGLWKPWSLTLKTCLKQSLSWPVAMHKDDQTPLKSMERFSAKALGFGSEAKGIIITLWLILLIPALSSNPLTEKERKSGPCWLNQQLNTEF